MKSKLWIFSLLFAFGFLLIPTSYWHNCTEKHTDASHLETDGVNAEEAACFICDFELFPAELYQPLQLKFKNVNPLVLNEQIQGIYASTPTNHYERGPPQI